MDIQIKVVCAESFNTIIYCGEERETKIYLYKPGNYFDVTNSMKALLRNCYYGNKCDKPYNNKNRHRCSTRMMFPNSAQNPCILRRRKIKYIAKAVTDTVLIKIPSIITMMSATKFINAKLVIKLN